jgi:hypothetical protein
MLVSCEINHWTLRCANTPDGSVMNKGKILFWNKLKFESSSLHLNFSNDFAILTCTIRMREHRCKDSDWNELFKVCMRDITGRCKICQNWMVGLFTLRFHWNVKNCSGIRIKTIKIILQCIWGWLKLIVWSFCPNVLIFCKYTYFYLFLRNSGHFYFTLIQNACNNITHLIPGHCVFPLGISVTLKRYLFSWKNTN